MSPSDLSKGLENYLKAKEKEWDCLRKPKLESLTFDLARNSFSLEIKFPIELTAWEIDLLRRCFNRLWPKMLPERFLEEFRTIVSEELANHRLTLLTTIHNELGVKT